MSIIERLIIHRDYKTCHIGIEAFRYHRKQHLRSLRTWPEVHFANSSGTLEFLENAIGHPKARIATIAPAPRCPGPINERRKILFEKAIEYSTIAKNPSKIVNCHILARVPLERIAAADQVATLRRHILF